MTSNLLKCQAFVLATRDLGESDRLVTLFTRTNGRIMTIAKGAKRSRRRFVNALEPCTLIQANIALPRTTGLSRLDSAAIEESYPSIRSDFKEYLYASLSCELVSLWTREGSPDKDIFDIFKWYLDGLSDGTDPKERTLFFKTRLLTLVGYAPDFGSCIRCKGAPVGPILFRIPAGGFICKACLEEKDGRASNMVNAGVIGSLRFIQKADPSRLSRLHLTGPTMNQAWNIIKGLHCHHLQTMPASYKVLSSI